MSKPVGIFFCALVFLAGCATSKKRPEKVISSPEPTQNVAAFNWADPNAAHHPRAPKRAVTPPVAPFMPVAKINAPPPVMPAPIGPAETMTWSSLNRWTTEHKLGAPRFLTGTPLTTYAMNSTNGEMILAIGSREANWNGVEINLGFAPELIDGQIFLHELDLRKNLEPLLCATPLAFGTNRVIVIDPGHGGMNVGTHSVLDGRFEKEFTLDWAQRLKPLLEANGWTVFLTRTSDTYVTNSDRVVFAESHHADVFISLHFNSAAPDTKQAGLETYCLTPTEMASTVTRGYSDDKADIFPNNFFDVQNLQLAVRLHSALLRASGEEDRSIRRARFMEVLLGQKRPAILIEGGYLSNPHEAKRIEDPAFRQKLAEAAANALK